jgi:hypothetical protein
MADDQDSPKTKRVRTSGELPGRAQEPQWEFGGADESAVTLAGRVDAALVAYFTLSWADPETHQRFYFELEVDEPPEDGQRRGDPRWVLSGELERSRGAFVISRITIEPWKRSSSTDDPAVPPGGVTSAVLRGLRLGWVHSALAYMATGRVANRFYRLEEFLRADEVPGTRAALALLGERRPQRIGRPRRSPEELREFAELFLATRGDHAAVSKELDGMPRETVRSWARAARTEGWLAPGQQGRKVPMPGPRLLDHQGREPNRGEHR